MACKVLYSLLVLAWKNKKWWIWKDGYFFLVFCLSSLQKETKYLLLYLLLDFLICRKKRPTKHLCILVPAHLSLYLICSLFAPIFCSGIYKGFWCIFSIIYNIYMYSRISSKFCNFVLILFFYFSFFYP